MFWDQPGLGRSARAAGNDYSLENLTRYLHAVVQFASDENGTRPITLIGHSIGGMLNLQYAKQYPQEMGSTIRGIVEAQTTYTNPARTARKSRLYTALQKPVLEPLIQASIYLSPVLWIMGVLSYLNGSTHLSNKRSGFAGRETYEQNDFIARYNLKSSPAVICRGMLGMARWDASQSLASIPVPTLVIPGDRDPNCVPEASEHMQARIPNARAEAITPGKHYGLIEQHGTFADLVRRFALGLT